MTNATPTPSVSPEVGRRAERASAVLGRLTGREKRPDHGKGRCVSLNGEAVPSVSNLVGVGAELDHVAEVGQGLDGPAAAAGVTIPDQPSPSSGLLPVLPDGGDPDVGAGVGSRGLSRSEPWATRRTCRSRFAKSGRVGIEVLLETGRVAAVGGPGGRGARCAGGPGVRGDLCGERYPLQCPSGGDSGCSSRARDRGGKASRPSAARSRGE